MSDSQPVMPPGVSDGEMQRRWSAVREMMRAENLDYLVIRNSENCLGGYLKWFSGLPAVNGYSATLIFPRDDEMSLIVHGASPPADPGPPPWAVRGVKNRLGAPYFSSMHFTSGYDAKLAVEVLKEKKDANIGLVGKSFIPLNFYEYLQAHLPGASFRDAAEQVDMIKVFKSPEEIELIKATAHLQDQVLTELKQHIKPGVKEYEVYAEAWRSAHRLGSTGGLILIGSGPSGSAVGFKGRHFQNRTIQDGDQISVLIEVKRGERPICRDRPGVHLGSAQPGVAGRHGGEPGGSAADPEQSAARSQPQGYLGGQQ
jgi:Xaa-Pro aminopeptidase